MDLSREEVAAFLATNEQRIRDLARKKLERSRSVFDSQDIFASVARRLDQLAVGKGVRPRSEAELWALIKVVTTNTALEKHRLVARGKALAETDGAYAQALLRRLETCATDDEATLLVHRMALHLPVSEDRQVLFLYLRGASFSAIAVALQSTENAVRRRWSRLREVLEERFGHGTAND